MEHRIKIKQCYLIHILENKKMFEVRLNDRDYQVGDAVQFLPIKDDDYDCYGYNKPLNYQITYVHTDFGLEEDYCVLGLQETGFGSGEKV